MLQLFLHMRASFPLLILIYADFFTALGFGEIHTETPNFKVGVFRRSFGGEAAATATETEQIAAACEKSRKEISLKWFGKESPNWRSPVCVDATICPSAPCGRTTFEYFLGRVTFKGSMMSGSRQALVDSVVPHEVNHMLMATYFRRVIPPWIEEGVACVEESQEEQAGYERRMVELEKANRRIPLAVLFQLTEFDGTLDEIRNMYAEAHSLTKFLIQEGNDGTQFSGERKFLRFVESAVAGKNWEKSLEKFYAFPSVQALEAQWLDQLLPSPKL